MSNSQTKYFDEQWNENPPFKKINNTLTTRQALLIVNLLSLHCTNEELLDDVELLKEWIKSR